MRRALCLAASLALAMPVAFPPAAVSAAAPECIGFGTSTWPRFAVSRDYNNIAGWYWPSAVELTVTANDPGTPAGTDIEFTVTPDVDRGFQGTQVLPGLEPGWFITVTDGEDNTKTHTVGAVSITFVDPATDIMKGTADPLTCVYAGGVGGAEGSWVFADSSGTWAVDLSVPDPPRGPIDITPGRVVGALQMDADDDFTFIHRVVPTTLDELLVGLVADGRLPNAGVARSITKQAANAKPQALTNHLSDLVRRGVITQLTMDQILVIVAM